MSHTTHVGPPAQPRAFDATSKLFTLILGVLSVLAGIVVGLNNPILSQAASLQGTEIDVLFSVTLGVATTVFVIVQGFLLYSIVRFGRQPGDDTDGPPIRGNTKLEVFWTIVPAITVVVISLLSYRVLTKIDASQPGLVPVEVTAQQYSWQFYYPEADITSNELHVPIDRQVFLKMRSNDVIHSFWVPAFRLKKDVLPNRVTELRFTATEPGTFPVVCTELCGAGHSLMRSQVVVESEADYKAWLAGKGKPATTAAGAADPLATGRALFTQAGCNACHALADAGAAGQVGPKLDGLGTYAANAVPGQSAEEYIHASIVKPNDHVVEGYPANVMPQDYGQRISEADLNTLVAYLLEMK
jgi:cytochrome c oxidase subunit II